MASHSHLCVAAIDIGTSFSSFMFSFRHDFNEDPLKQMAPNWTCGGGSLMTNKTPTALLLNPDETFNSFGYEAEDEYLNLVQEDDHREHYFFQNFKMTLYTQQFQQQDLSKEAMIEDITQRKSMKAVDVFAHSIGFFRRRFLEYAKSKGIAIQEADVFWVITVPAIWNERAVKLMRDAAAKASIIGSRSVICKEAVAASLYCNYQPIEKVAGTRDEFMAARQGMKYLVLDAGGGTTDMTVVEVQDDRTLKEIAISSEPCGAGLINDCFLNFLNEMFTVKVVQDFKEKHLDDYFEIMRQFECRKRTFKNDNQTKVTLQVPSTLLERFEELTQSPLRSNEKATIVRDKLRIERDIFAGFFTNAVKGIVPVVAEMVHAHDPELIMMVGGFSECYALLNKVVEIFPNLRIINPPSAQTSVLRGAVIYGHSPIEYQRRENEQAEGRLGELKKSACTPSNENAQSNVKEAEKKSKWSCRLL